MKVYSVHSHKGGVGKTTFALFLSKYLAQVKKEKTCLVDFDFQAHGLRGAYFRGKLQYDFLDFLLADEKKKKEIAAQITVKSRDFDNLYFIASHFKPYDDIQHQLEILKKMYIKLVNEIYTGEIMDTLEELLNDLEKTGFKNIIIDDHPGLILLSEEIIKEIKATPLFITTGNIVSFVGMFKNILGRADEWKLDLAGIKIIVNRVPDNFLLPGLAKALEVFIDSSETTEDEKLVCSGIKKYLLDRENGLMFIPESEKISKMDTLVNPQTLLSMDIPVELRRVIEKVIDG